MGTEQPLGGEHLPPPDDPSVLREPLPVPGSIPWSPVLRGAGEPEGVPYPVFVSQRALARLQSDVAGFTLLVGRLARCPVTGTSYIVIRDSLAPPQAVPGERPYPVLARAWKRVSEDLAQDGSRVLGWHRAHSDQGTMPTLADLEMHRQLFTQPWHLALVTGAVKGLPAGYFYRPQEGTGGQLVPLPFFELCEGRPGAAQKTVLTWMGYTSIDADLATPQPRSSRPTPALNPAPEISRPSGSPVLMPVYQRDPDDPAWSGRRYGWPRLPKALPYVLVAAFGALAVLAINALRDPPPELVQVPVMEAVTPAQDSLARAAEALDQAVKAYGEKQSLFDQRMMVCSDLAAALVEVEERFVSFSALRGAGSGASASEAARHESIAAAVDSVDIHYGRSRCARP